MAQFTMAIAGHSFTVRSIFGSTRDYCARYPATGAPEAVLEILLDQLPREQEALRQEAIAESLKPRTFSDPFLERSLLQKMVAHHLRPHGILLLHGSTVAVDGRAYLFTAPCGTGKSTHTRLWREVFGQRAVMINDDKTFLRIDGSGVTAYGAPWSGKHGLDTNIAVPLAGICLLERGTENEIHPWPPEAAAAFLESQACSPDPAPLIARLIRTVPLHHLHCTPTPDAARFSYGSICKEAPDL